MTVKPGEKYLKLKLNGCGLKGFDIYGYIERCIKKDSNPKHPDQLEFKIPRSTRFYRSKAQKNMKNKSKIPRKKRKSKLKIPRKLKTHKVQVMTPMRSKNPDPFYRKVSEDYLWRKKQQKYPLSPRLDQAFSVLVADQADRNRPCQGKLWDSCL